MTQELPSAFSSMIDQLLAAEPPAPKRQSFNPRPPGVIQPGSATEAVLALLTEIPGFLSEGQLIWKTKRSHSAVSWALIRLRQYDIVEAISDPDRPRQNRYRLKRGAP